MPFLRSWGLIAGGLSEKFWKILRREGFARCLIRGNKYVIHTHEKAGFDELVRLVGTDEYGNKFYEDFTSPSLNTRRWIEYSDNWAYLQVGKKVGPGWSGWLHYTYEDPPRRENFVQPFYRRARSFVYEGAGHPNWFLNRGDPLHPQQKEFIDKERERDWSSWKHEEMSQSCKKQGKRYILPENSIQFPYLF